MKSLCVIISMLLLSTRGASFGQAQDPLFWLRADGNVQDATGAHPAVLVDTVYYTAGRTGQGFFAAGGYVRIADSARLRPANRVTVQAWVRGSTQGQWRYILQKSRSGGYSSYAFYTGGGGGLGFYVAKEPSLLVSPFISPTAIWDNEWHQVTGTYDGTNVALYLDGVLVGATSTTEAADISYLKDHLGGDLTFGNFSATTGGGLQFVGRIDEVKIFDRTLSAAEVEQTFANASSAAGTQGLIGWWRGENDAKDSAGDHHGTLPGANAVTYFDGRDGKAFLSPKGVVQVPNHANLSPATAFTLQAWVQSVGVGNNQYIISKANPGTPSWGIYEWGGVGTAFFVTLDGALLRSATIPSAAVWDGAWHQLTGTFDGNQLRMFFDGVEVGEPTPGLGAIDYSTDDRNGNVIIGQDFAGVIDDVKMFNQALTPAQILASYTGGRLAGWWRAESDAKDTAGANHGTAAGTVAYGSSRLVGKAFQLQAGSIQIPDAPSLRPASLSLEALVRGAAPLNNQSIISKANVAGSPSYALSTDAQGRLTFRVNLSSGMAASPAVDPALIWDNNWHAIAASYDGTRVRIYLDGVEVGAGTPASGSVQYGTVDSAGKLLFGAASDAAGAPTFQGAIDEVKLYGQALAAQAVAANAFRPVIIYRQPASQGVRPGSTVSFSAAAFAPPKVFYQWKLNGVDVPGATAATLVLTNVQAGQAGQYTVSISDKRGLVYPGETPAGTGQSFNTEGGLAAVPNSPSLQPASLTVQLWARSSRPPGAYNYLLSKSRASGVGSYALYTGGSAGLFFYVGTGPSTLILSPNAGTGVWDGNWHQITGTYENEGFLRLYVDGQEVGSGVNQFGSIDYTLGDYSGDLVFGDYIPTPTIYSWPGYLDNVKIFDRALSAAEILESFNNPNASSSPAGLISWWKYEGNMADASGSNHGLVLTRAFAASQPATLEVLSQALLVNAEVSGGNFRATVSGPTGQRFVVRQSLDLITSIPIETNTVPFTFSTPVTGSSAAFYWAVAE